MRVNLACLGRFHVFELAAQMDRLGHLEKLYTGVPKSKIKELSKAKVRNFPWLSVPTYFAARLGYKNLQARLNMTAITTFDDWLCRQIRPSDIFYSLSGFSTKAHKVAKERFNALTICDRGSSHIVFQDQILAEEYKHWNVPYQPIDPRIIERELSEYEFCDLVTVPSEFVKRSFVQKGIPEHKIAKIPYGVDLKMFRPAKKQDEKFRIVYVGAITLRKGVQYLLEAVAQLTKYNIELVLIGAVAEEAKPFLQKYSGYYRHLGIINRSELYHYYSQGSVFAIASLEEGLALVQAQAMACGLPIIATFNTGAEDLFTDGQEGFILPIRNPEAIRGKILYLYENPQEREAMGAAALQRVQQMGGWNSYGELAAQTYQQALQNLKRS